MAPTISSNHRRASLPVGSAAAIRDTPIYWGFIALLVWAPLPLASNRYWAVGILLAWTLALFAATLFVWRGQAGRAWGLLRAQRWPLMLLAGFALLTSVQAWPLPAAWVAALSPESQAVWAAALDTTGALVSTLAIDPFQARYFASQSVIYLLAFVIAVLLLRRDERIDTLASALVWSGLFQALLAAALFSMGAQYELFFTKITHSRTLGSFVYHNNLAGYLVMTLSVGIGLMLSRLDHSSGPRLRRWQDWVSAGLEFMLSSKMRLRLMLVVMVIALVLTRSRMGNTAFFAAMLVVGVLALLLSRRAAPATVTLIVSLIVVDILVIGGWIGLEKVVHRVQETALLQSDQMSEETVEQRTAPGRHALDLVADFPVFGSGGGSFYNAFSRYRPPETQAYFDHTHNDYLEIAADTGGLGLGLLALLALASLGRMLWVLRVRQAPLARGTAFGVSMVIVALLIHSTVDFNLQIPANALTLTVILALGWCASTRPGSVTSAPQPK